MIHLDGFLDIECANWDKMVCGALYRPIDGTTMVRTPDKLVDELMRRGGTWWAWGGGKFDSLQVAEILRSRGLNASCRMSGSGVSTIVSGHLTIVDAMALIPMGLEKAAPLAGLQAPELGWDCTCRSDCGGYCQIRSRGMDLVQMAELQGYCAEDARVGYEVVAAVLTRFARAGMEVRATLGGTAWETARRWAGLPDAVWRSEVWRWIRRAYFGGRVIVTRPRASSGTHHDLASAYPAALAATELPLGEPVEAAGQRARLAYARGIPGVYRARVRVRDDEWIPPLPVRSDPTDLKSDVWYPIGSFTGVWAGNELRAAEASGVKVIDIEECIAWPDGAGRILAGAVERWYAHRQADGKQTAWGKLWGLVPNSLTGKFAESPERHAIVINPSTVKYCDGVCDRSVKAGCRKNHCTERCGSYQQMDRSGRVYAIPFYRLGESAHIHWAAYTTAASRIDVAAGFAQVGRDLCYSDTDSIWTIGNRPSPEGDELGQWSLKGRWGDLSVLAPKVYRFVSEDGEVVCRVAGAPDVTDQRWQAGALSSDRGVMTLREAARTDKLFRRRTRFGTLPDASDGWYGDRVLDVRTGLTHPVRYGQAKSTPPRDT
jgi:hypothetical protein